MRHLHDFLSVNSDPIGMNEHLKRDGCDIVITDYWLGWSDGLSILQRVRERWPRSRVINQEVIPHSTLAPGVDLRLTLGLKVYLTTEKN
jgi:DNA-binding NarL/FixJ family response regulator